MAFFKKPNFKASAGKTREMPEGLWTKCPSCGDVIHNLALADNLRVCPKCSHHFTMGAHERIASLVDPGSFAEMDANMTSVDTLEFKGTAAYTDRLKDYQEKTGLKDAVITGTAAIEERPLGLAVMDFNFLAATMGSVVGEKITRLIELSTKKKYPVVIVSASGGARMYEGMLSLMQMAKTSGALALHAEAKLPFISVLTNPTTAGVMASYASLGDIILAEPKSMIGFAGPRVIKETTHQDLPPGFQTAEFLEKHGLIDLVAPRARLRATLASLLEYLTPGREVTCQEALAWLYATQLFGIKLGLESVRRLLAALGHPEMGGRFLHVAGTNGKGSVCAMMESVLRADGVRTGLYTSPHLIDFRERIRVNGEKISEADLAAGLTRIRALVEGWDPFPTFFEISTVLALDHFARAGCKVVVLETGMGGRLDATNVVTPIVSILTPIAMDHEKWLGSSLEEIAGEKAGIIKPGVPVASARQRPEAEAVIRSVAAERGCALEFVSEPLDAECLALAGEHQKDNAALANLALRTAGWDISVETLHRGLASVQWPGRFQIAKDRFVVDGAHNPHAAARLVRTWREKFGDTPATIIFGALMDKDVPGILNALEPLAEKFVFVPVQSQRAMPPESLPELTKRPSRVAASVREALATEHSLILITGSLFLVGEALDILGIEV